VDILFRSPESERIERFQEMIQNSVQCVCRATTRGVVGIGTFAESNGNAAEQVEAGGWPPCRADEGARLKRRRIIMEAVDYTVDEFLWKNARGHGKDMARDGPGI
jgi:hypothetical protein